MGKYTSDSGPGSNPANRLRSGDMTRLLQSGTVPSAQLRPSSLSGQNVGRSACPRTKVGIMFLLAGILVLATCHHAAQSPQSLDPGDGKIVALPLFLSWSSEPNASGYEVQADTTREFGSPLVNASVEDTFYPLDHGLPKGRYWWRVAARNAVGELSVYSATDSFKLVASAYPRNVVAVVPVGSSPNSCAITPDGREVWVDNADSTDGHVYVVSTEELAVTHRIPTLGFDHAKLVISNDGQYAYCCQRVHWPDWPDCYGGIAQMSTTLDSTVSIFGYTDFNGDIIGPIGYGITLNPQGDIVVAVDQNNPWQYPMVYSFCVTDGLWDNLYSTWIDDARDVESAHRHACFYVLGSDGTFSELDAESLGIQRQVNITGGPRRLLKISADDRYAFVTRADPPSFTVVDLGSFSVAACCSLSHPAKVHYAPFSLALSPSERWLYFGEEDTGLVHVADISDPLHPRFVETLTLGTGRIRDICFSPDEQRAYVSMNPDGVVVLEP